jgi:hypothetical protein
VNAAGEKLAMELWSLTAQENLRALRRLCAEDSPAAAAIRLYGAAGPAVAIGLAPRESPQSLTTISESHGRDELAGTWDTCKPAASTTATCCAGTPAPTWSPRYCRSGTG